MFSNNSSGFIGVSLHKRDKKWHSRVRHKNVMIHVGCFDSDEEAARARDKVVKKLRGKFAVLNFPEEI